MMAFFREDFRRRIAFLVAAAEQATRRAPAAPPGAGGQTLPGECSVIAVVAHWRGSGERSALDDEPLLRSLSGLLELDVRRLDIVVVTDQERAAAEAIRRRLTEAGQSTVDVTTGGWSAQGRGRRRIMVERWRPRWPYRHGFYLTWAHKGILRRALRSDAFTHFLALEDDIGFRKENFAYWLAARSQLHLRGLIPGYLLFEWEGIERRLLSQSRPGQHEPVGAAVSIEGIGEVSVRRSLRPYQAFFILDAPLVHWHLTRSPMRSPLRSAVSDWGVRERAVAGETFGEVESPFRSAFSREPNGTPFVVRQAVLARSESGSDVGRFRPIEGALVEHLRPRYAADPAMTRGKVRVEDY